MSEVGDRIREERERLGLTQDALGVTSKTQRLYENGERSPDAAYLKNFSQLGADVLYILNGQRAGGTLAPELQRVLNAWRTIPPATQDWLLALLERSADATGYTPPNRHALVGEASGSAEGPAEFTMLASEIPPKDRKRDYVSKPMAGGRTIEPASKAGGKRKAG